MPQPVFEVATGTIDGSNTTFQVSRAYQPGSLAVWLNGQLKTKALDDGWVETLPATGTFDMDQAPLPGDVIQAFFLDTSPVLPGEEITGITGTLVTAPDELTGALFEQATLSASILPLASLTGSLEAPVGILGTLDPLVEITGSIEVCE